MYRRDDNGWYQRGEDGWNRVEVPEERAAQIDQARTQAAERRDSLGQVDSASISERRQSVGDAWSGRTYDSSRSLGSFDANRRSELNRNFNARTNGYDRFDRRVQNNSRINQSRQRGGRVERRFR